MMGTSHTTGAGIEPPAPLLVPLDPPLLVPLPPPALVPLDPPALVPVAVACEPVLDVVAGCAPVLVGAPPPASPPVAAPPPPLESPPPHAGARRAASAAVTIHGAIAREEQYMRPPRARIREALGARAATE
ncbi:MAG TPA: hypothetical protein VGM56_31555 [Byssovorax sp.]|jgi:hypothetical protein